MPPTTIRGRQVLDGSIQRVDLDTTTTGQAVTTKIVQGTNVTISSSGIDPGTGDVTISATSAIAGPAGLPAYTTLTSGFTVPAVGSTVTVNVNDATWAAVGETVWVATAGASGAAGAMIVNSKTSTTLTLQNPYV